jgi:MFS family permease
MSSRRQLGLIALVQVLAMALWFSASAVVPSLREEWSISQGSAALLTVAVQVGFVTGAVTSALLNLADRVRPGMLIGVCAAVGALATAALAAWSDALPSALALRFVTGCALAGVYPVGLRLMASWFDRRRGFALGVLVGALTLGSALPQLLNGLTHLPWRGVLAAASALALASALLSVTLLRPGPHAAPAPPFEPRYVLRMVADRRQRLVNLGYLGHMWELYALWTWLPAFIAASYAAWRGGSDTRAAVGISAFCAIGLAGVAGCLVAGWIADHYGRARTTIVAMAVSASCCMLAAPAFGADPLILVPLLLVWGAAVIADSAQFSAALSEVADRRYVGTALTAQTATGFLLTIATIQGLPLAVDAIGWRGAMPLLGIGPVAGAVAMMRLRKHERWEQDERVGRGDAPDRSAGGADAPRERPRYRALHRDHR